MREYEASASLFAESRAKRSELQEAVKEYEGELRALRQEMDLQARATGRRGWLGRGVPLPCRRRPCCCCWRLSLAGAAAAAVLQRLAGALAPPPPAAARPVTSTRPLPAPRHPHACLSNPPPPPSPCSLLQRQILDKLREHERGIDKEVQEIIDERRRWRDKMVRARLHRTWER